MTTTDPSTTAGPTPGTERHRTAVWRYLRALGADPIEADDLTQDTMLVGCARELPGGDAARAFLRGVARNLWLRSRRWWQRRREREVAVAVDELWLATAEADDGDELLARLGECLQLLQPRARKALDLHYGCDMGWNDVSTQIGLQPNGTKTLVQRARQTLRACLERRRS
ncbi:MAG TPA: sigma-70 family RNA polymerase sigma factor [Planctomycetota bacterium]|nr:sigma-70 family RNA polymerase sigma factor [Planctomycetota bacterium]